MNRRTFISTTSAAAMGLGATTLASIRNEGNKTMSTATSHKDFWPDKARLVISISMQFETGAQPERGAGSPFPLLDAKYPDLPAQKWYDYGFKEGIPRLLDIWHLVAIKITPHILRQPAR